MVVISACPNPIVRFELSYQFRVFAAIHTPSLYLGNWESAGPALRLLDRDFTKGRILLHEPNTHSALESCKQNYRNKNIAPSVCRRQEK